MRILLIVVAVIVVLTTASWLWWSAFLQDAGFGSSEAQLTCPRPPSDDLTAAMFAIYYHAYVLGWQPTPAPTPGLAVMPLQTAASIVATAPVPDADTKRARAIGILVAAGKIPQQVSGTWEPPAIDLALRTIMDCSPAGTCTPLEGIAQALLALDVQLLAPGESARAMKQSVTRRSLNSLAGNWKQRCCACLEAYDVDAGPFHPTDGMVWFRIAVERPLGEIRKTVDPQSWSCCHPDTFDASYLLEDEDCTDVPAAPACVEYEPDAAANPPGLGTAWGCGVLYEHYHPLIAWSSSSCEVDFNTLLQLDATTENTCDYVIDYGLCQSIDGSICGATCAARGIETDCGFVKAKPINPTNCVSDWSTVEAVKFLTFEDDSTLNWMDPAFRMLMEATLYEGVCCGVTTTTSCLCPTAQVNENIQVDAPFCGDPSCEG